MLVLLLVYDWEWREIFVGEITYAADDGAHFEDVLICLGW